MTIEKPNEINQELNESNKELFNSLSYKYEKHRPIEDSIVRLDQEEEIYEDLENNKSILIRGNWRAGKTSMLKSLENHKFGKENSIFIDVAVLSSYSLEEFKKIFGKYQIIDFISQKTNQDENKVEEQIKNSGKTPIEYLIQYLEQNSEENIFLEIDEVISLAQKNPEALKYLASLKNVSQIKLAIVLHRFHSFEEDFKKIFDGFETHFVKPLSFDEAKKLVLAPLKDTPITFSNDAIKKILEFSGGRPYEINNLCHAIMSDNSESSNQKLNYEKSDIEKAINNYHDLYSDISNVVYNYEAIYLKSLSQEERDIIDLLITKKQIPISDIDKKIIQPLIDTTFVRLNEKDSVYEINGSFFQICLEKNLIRKK
ncbi:MAG: hypothetical protein PHZ07_02450 [Patescibacteria group bacterium]|nr:hypothetical protein [Patescibacteria group bacterium]MDD4304260.1 hypothetical protein [Patescibacteria group bacterium]MDD4695314.1 hypothetical protein [Patescibacteria group bacterium]